MRRSSIVLLAIIAGLAAPGVATAQSATLQVTVKVVRPVPVDVATIRRSSASTATDEGPRGDVVVSASGAAVPVALRFEGAGPAGGRAGASRVTILLDGDPPPPAR